MGLFFLLSYVSYITPESTTEKILNQVVLKNSYYISDFPLYSKQYIELTDRDALTKLKQATDEIDKMLSLIDSGGKVTIEDKDYYVQSVKEENLQLRKQDFAQQFKTNKEKVLILWNQNLYAENSDGSYIEDGGGTGKKRLNPDIEEAHEYINISNRALQSKIDGMHHALEEYIVNKERNKKIFHFVLMSVVALLAARTTVLVVNQYIRPMEIVMTKAYKISEVKFEKGKNHIKYLADVLSRLGDEIKDITEFASKIGEGDFKAQFKMIGQQDRLGRSLLEMRDRLAHFSEEERKRSWSTEGLAKVTDILNQFQRDGFEELTFEFIKFIVNHLKVNQAAVFLVNEDDKFDPHIALVSSYAFDKRKYLTKKTPLKYGMVGQCIEEKGTIYMEDVPQNYLFITSGLGEANPRSLVLIPIRHDEKVLGAVELASFTKLKQHEITFLEAACERLGSTISLAKMNIRTKLLLEQSQFVNQELHLKEDMMRKNTEELRKTQSELNKKLAELEYESNLIKNILQAINKTNVSVEFDMKGTILEANEMFTQVMSYEKFELIGKNESMMVVESEKRDGMYETLWESLREGKFMSGEFKRINRLGKEIWLNGAYNPIFDLDGKPYKVILLAQFTTEEKEKDLDYASKLDALNGMMPMLELSPDIRILNSNQNFQHWLGYTRQDLRKVSLASFVLEKAQVEKVAKQIARGDNLYLDLTMLTPTSQERFALVQFYPMKNLSGQIHKILAVFTDLTERKKLESELHQRQEILSDTVAEMEAREALLNKSTLIAELDERGNILMLNHNMTEMLQDEKGELLGERFFKLIKNEAQRDELAQHIQSESKEIKRLQIELFKMDANTFMVDMVLGPVLNNDGTPEKFIAFMLEVNQMRNVN
jgi:PAS domain S-box-containing protein